jgi:hypothetical protein
MPPRNLYVLMLSPKSYLGVSAYATGTSITSEMIPATATIIAGFI